MPPRELLPQAVFCSAMSIPLTQEERSESALVAFTLLVPASAGVALFALAFGGGVRPAITALALACVGMTGSITHLAKPLRAPTSLRNVRSSWLSREIAAVSVFRAFKQVPKSTLISALKKKLRREYNHLGWSICAALRLAITGFFDP